MSTGLLWLEGPLQSWGYDSRYGRRTTLEFPTRSGILGMIAAAMGKPGEQREWLRKMRDYRQTVVAFNRMAPRLPWETPDDEEERRIIKAPVLKDFHMVGSGYNPKDPWQDLFILKKNDGSRPSNSPGTKITHRHYLQDMAFACALELPDDEPIGDALQYPVWDLCLGRKSCVPSDIIWRGEYPTEDAALAAAAEIAKTKDRIETFRVYDGVYDDPEADKEVFSLSDVPISFGLYKRYADRLVSKVVNA